jgi:biopolymer transport protein ExbD
VSLSRRAGRRNAATAELNITVFMNLMVILVPFLLITAVFSRTAILELYLPGATDAPADADQPVFQLEVTIRKDRIEVGDRNVGAFGVYPKQGDEYDYEALSRKLAEIKRDYPAKTDAAILLEADIRYDTLVQVMDRVRITERFENGALVRRDLFPDISIGDAPAGSGGP